MAREIKFQLIWSDGSTMAKQVVTLDEMISGLTFPLVKKKKLPLIAKRQFTGLKDRDGVEIYEGDIIESEFHAPDESYPAIGVVNWCELDCAQWLVKDDFGENDPLQDWYNDCKVIGNIHQNPELLKN